MAQPQLSEQDQEAWELYCDSSYGATAANFWHELSSITQLIWRIRANAARIERSAPWRHA